jgi:hypothetical protein
MHVYPADKHSTVIPNLRIKQLSPSIVDINVNWRASKFYSAGVQKARGLPYLTPRQLPTQEHSQLQ